MHFFAGKALEKLLNTSYWPGEVFCSQPPVRLSIISIQPKEASEEIYPIRSLRSISACVCNMLESGHLSCSGTQQADLISDDWSTFSPTVKSQSRYVMNEMTISEGKQWTGRDQLGTLHVADNGCFLICRSAVAKVFLIDARMWVVARVFWVVTGLSCVVALLLWAVAAVQCSGLLPGCSRWLLGLC